MGLANADDEGSARVFTPELPLVEVVSGPERSSGLAYSDKIASSVKFEAVGGPITILIAEDNEDLRTTMVSLLSGEADIRCVAETDELNQVRTLAAATSPQVIILDIELKGRSSLPALAQLRRELPTVRFLIYSGYALPEMMRAALAAGASEYLLKSGDPYELISAIRRCAVSED